MRHGFRVEVSNEPRRISDRKLIKFGFNVLLPRKRLIIFAWVLITISTFVNLLPELFLKQILDQGVSGKNLSIINRDAILMIIVFIISWILSFTAQLTIVNIGESSTLEIKDKMFAKLLNHTQSYFDKHKSGEINSRITNDVNSVSNFLGLNLIDIVNVFLQLIGILLIMLSVDLTLTLISASMIPLFVLLGIFLVGPLRRISMKRRKDISKVTSSVAENISGIKETKNFATEKKVAKSFEQVNKENYQSALKATSMFSLLSPLMTLFGSIGTALIFIFVGYNMDIYTAGVLALFYSYLNKFFGSVIFLTTFYSSYQAAFASLERIYEFMEEEPEITDPNNGKNLIITKGEILFDSVSFSYDKKVTIYQNFSTKFEGKNITAIVGETGAGKSTLVKLISRFYSINTGKILIDGQDISLFDRTELRSHIGFITQTPKLFNLSVLENLKYGSPAIEEDQVIQIAKLVGLHNLISKLPNGYNTQITSKSNLFSMGQRQLVSFCRVILKNPPIILMDEATSSLDSISEFKIHEALSVVFKDKTAIIIAHRLSTIRNADHILVIDGGRVIEEGSHRSLIDQKGKYYSLYKKQVHRLMKVSN